MLSIVFNARLWITKWKQNRIADSIFQKSPLVAQHKITEKKWKRIKNVTIQMYIFFLEILTIDDECKNHKKMAMNKDSYE